MATKRRTHLTSMYSSLLALLLATAMAAGGCSDSDNPNDISFLQEPTPVPSTDPLQASGSFNVISYNVAGLPSVISGSKPEEKHPLISPLLNAYDVVLAQEDFCHHPELAQDAEHTFQSTPLFDPPCTEADRVGDGLNRFSGDAENEFPSGDTFFQFSSLGRVTWEKCNGDLDCKNDCLTPKGFSFARHEIMPGAEIDIYNLHMDAGSCPGDFDARGDQVLQLLAEMAIRSSGRAVIVAGDTNLKDTRTADAEILDVFLDTASLTDACRAVDCGDERLDRIMIRSSDRLTLKVADWFLAEEFVDDEGEDLSDHKAVVAEIEWELR